MTHILQTTLRLRRPREEVFNMAYQADDQATLGKQLVEDYHIRDPGVLTSCSTCHR